MPQNQEQLNQTIFTIEDEVISQNVIKSTSKAERYFNYLFILSVFVLETIYRILLE